MIINICTFGNRRELDRKALSPLIYRNTVYGAFNYTGSALNYLQHQMLAWSVNNYEEAGSGRGLILLNTVRSPCKKLRNPIRTPPLCFTESQAAVCVQCVAQLCMVVPKRPVVFDPCQNHTCRLVCNYADVIKRPDIEYWLFQELRLYHYNFQFHILFYFCSCQWWHCQQFIYIRQYTLFFSLPQTSLIKLHTDPTLQYSTVQYSTAQYSTVQYSTAQYSTAQYCTVQYSTVQYSTVQYSTVQYSTVQYSTAQYSTVQYNTVQYSTVQYSTVQYSTVHYSTHNKLPQNNI